MLQNGLKFLGTLESNGKKIFGFKSPKFPPAIDELEPFELDLQKMISNMEFRHIGYKFLSKLSEDIKNIKKIKELFINADNSTNIYKMPKENCQSIYKTKSLKHTKNPIESESMILTLMLKIWKLIARNR